MMLLMTCCFGILLSYTIGLFFSFNYVVATLALALFSFCIHYFLYRLGLSQPPGNFFFIMLTSIALCTPYDPAHIAEKTGYIAMGTMATCIIGLLYSLLTLRGKPAPGQPLLQKGPYTNIVESISFGVFMGLAAGIAFLLRLDNPYWVPVSCAAVMQGTSSKHIWWRSAQRMIGTLIGIGVAWAIALIHPTPFFMMVGIIVLQIIVEFLVVRNYTIAVIFITVLTTFLAESGSSVTQNTNQLFLSRVTDIFLGSIIGAIGGWVLFNEHVHYVTTLQLRRTKLIIRKRLKKNIRGKAAGDEMKG
jgi:uncharacterized membrane protein YccC